MRIVFDASALIALIFNENGASVVKEHLQQAVLSTVNLVEVASYISERGLDFHEIEELIKDLSFEIVPFTEEQAFLAAELRVRTKSYGLSLGDRSCLALAIKEDLPVLTADTAWSKIDSGINIILIR